MKSKVESHNLKKKSTSIPGLPYDSDIIEKSKKMNLKPTERLLLLRLRSYMFDADEKTKRPRHAFCYPSQETLAQEIGISRRLVITLIQKLKKMGLITVSTRNPNGKGLGNHHNQYQFIYPWQTTTPGPGKSDISKVQKTSHSTDFKSADSDISKVQIPTFKSADSDFQKCRHVHTNKKEQNKRNKSSSSKQKPKYDDDDSSPDNPKQVISSQATSSAPLPLSEDPVKAVCDSAPPGNGDGKPEKRKLTYHQKLDQWKRLLTKKGGSDFAERAFAFANENVKDRHDVKSPAIYKLRILRSIYEDDQPDFKYLEDSRPKVISTKILPNGKRIETIEINGRIKTCSYLDLTGDDEDEDDLW